MAREADIILVFCWAHVRRDFLSIANKWPQQEEWANEWVELIGNLYHLNNSRLEKVDQPEFNARDKKLRQAVDEMAQKMETERQDENTHHACKKVLDSLDNHWDGLTVFVDHPNFLWTTTKRKGNCAVLSWVVKIITDPVPNGAVD